MLRRITGWIVLVPLCLVLIVFALANRQPIVVNFNPLVSPATLAASGMGVPLFLVIFVILLIGVVLGGVATWFASGSLRRERRRWRREAEKLQRELDAARRPRGGRNASPAPIDDLMDTY